MFGSGARNQRLEALLSESIALSPVRMAPRVGAIDPNRLRARAALRAGMEQKENEWSGGGEIDAQARERSG
jgi:hypothetical protein